jgi:hypothetical protein
MTGVENCPVCQAEPTIHVYEKLEIMHCPSWCKSQYLKTNYVVAKKGGCVPLWNKKITGYKKKLVMSHDYQFVAKYGKEEFEKAFKKKPVLE